jgi:hypothetical protein
LGTNLGQGLKISKFDWSQKCAADSDALIQIFAGTMALGDISGI